MMYPYSCAENKTKSHLYNVEKDYFCEQKQFFSVHTPAQVIVLYRFFTALRCN